MIDRRGMVPRSYYVDPDLAVKILKGFQINFNSDSGKA